MGRMDRAESPPQPRLLPDCRLTRLPRQCAGVKKAKSAPTSRETETNKRRSVTDDERSAIRKLPGGDSVELDNHERRGRRRLLACAPMLAIPSRRLLWVLPDEMAPVGRGLWSHDSTGRRRRNAQVNASRAWSIDLNGIAANSFVASDSFHVDDQKTERRCTRRGSGGGATNRRAFADGD